jgi:formate--tetrahydrofolate ligase
VGGSIGAALWARHNARLQIEKNKPMPSDIEIAQAAPLRRITDLARERLGIAEEHLVPYGHFKAKLALPFIDQLESRPEGKLVLVTAISPTPAGEGKTTTTVGLGDALAQLGHKTVIALREPSLGPVFGMKGGAAGGGRSQVLPMEDINLHFTGDFAAVALAHNLLAAVIDNHIHHGNALGIDPRRISWRRVVDLNDRALRHIISGLGGAGDGVPREAGFDIVAASEVMAILCLAQSLGELKSRLGAIVIGETFARQPVRAADLGVHGAMAVLLKDALAPNLVQTIEGTPAFVHGGPFANIAHGCNSVLATRSALRLADWVVTEAGFGADLGAEKFIDIKCRASGLRPRVAVLVATVRALKYHGGVAVADLGREDLEALQRGLANLERHLHNLRQHFGLGCVVALNVFAADTAAEHALVQRFGAERGVAVCLARHWAEGGAGALDLAREVLRLGEGPAAPRLLYEDELPLIDKLRRVAERIYGAAEVKLPAAVRKRLDDLQAAGHGHLPVCIAKTQYSFATDATLRGAPSGHVLDVRELRLAAGAGFIVAVCGEIMTMPGLPKVPAAERIDLDAQGRITGLS